MDAALATSPSSSAAQHLFKTATSAESPRAWGSSRRMNFLSLFSASSKHMSGASRRLSLDGLQAQFTGIRVPEELISDSAHSAAGGRANQKQQQQLCSCYFLRQSYASAVEEWTLKQCSALCGEACRGVCSACSIVVVGSNVFLAQTGSLRVYRSSKIWKKLNVTHDGPSPSPEGEITPRIVEFKVESDAAFVLVVSESVTKAITSMEAFDIVRSSLKKRACSKSAAEALLTHVRGIHNESSNDPEDLVCLVILWTSGQRGIASLSESSE